MSAPVPVPTRVVAYVPDLMDRSRLTRLGDVPVVHVARPEDLVVEARDTDLVVVDVARRGVLDVLDDVAGHVVGFASHVDTELIAAAQAAGCTEVEPRSKFFAGLGRRLAIEE